MKKFALVAAVAGTLSLMAVSNAFADAAAALTALDPDKDGTVDLVEVQAGGTKLFTALDPDKDGTLDRLARTSDSVEATANRMSRSNLPSALQATEDTARAARRVDRAAGRLEDNPQQLIFGAGSVAPGPGEPGFTPPRKTAP